MDRKQKLGLTVFMAVFVVAACLVSLRVGEAPKKLSSTRLSDGRLVQLELASFGRTHVLRDGSEWRYNLQRAFPPPLRGLLGGKVNAIKTTTSGDMLIPFLSIDQSPGGKKPDWGRWRVVAQNGQDFDTGAWSSGREFGDRTIAYPRVDVFPRRDDFFFLTGMVDRLPFTIKIPNPQAKVTYPVWAPGPLGATNQHDGFEFVLSTTEFARYDRTTGFRTGVDAYKDGERINRWFRTSYELRDATGNEGWRIPTNEPAWQIDFKLRREYAAPWHPHEYHEITIADIPTEAEYRIVNLNRTINGIQINRFWFGGKGEFTLANGVMTNAVPLRSGRGGGTSSSSYGSGKWKLEWRRREPWMMFEMPRLTKDVELTVFVIDGKGNHATADYTGSMSAGGFRVRKHDLKFPKQPEPPFTLRMAIQTNLHTIFTVDPAKIPRIDRRKRGQSR